MVGVPLYVDLPALGDPWEGIAKVVLAFALAWLVSRSANRLAVLIVRRYERRKLGSGAADTGVLVGLKRRDTAVSLIRTTVQYAVFGAALVFTILTIGDFFPNAKVTAIASASLLVLLIGFAAQRFLTDILAGLFMFFEGWYAVGDTVIIEPLKLEGVVEQMSLHATRLRAVNGERVHVHNSQIYATRVLPRGVRELDIEMFVTDAEAGTRLIDEVARLVPTSPLHFIRRPWVAEVEELDDDLIRIKSHVTIAPGREWLAQEFLPSLIKERAGDDLIVHGPVVIDVDEVAVRPYARTLAIAKDRQPPG
jgi:moderate conductance mechanosensitive channel